MLDKSVKILQERLDGVKRALEGTKAEVIELKVRLSNVQERMNTQLDLATDLEQSLLLLQNSQGIIDKAGDE